MDKKDSLPNLTNTSYAVLAQRAVHPWLWKRSIFAGGRRAPGGDSAHIHFGSEKFLNWPAVMDYLRPLG